MAFRIRGQNRVILAICKHVARNGIFGIRAGVDIGVNEPMVRRVVVAGLEVIEPGFGIVVIPAITQRVRACHAAGLRENIAPSVILIRGCYCAILIDELHDVALKVQNVVIRGESVAADGRVVQRKRPTGSVVDEIHDRSQRVVGRNGFANDFSVRDLLPRSLA